MLTGEQFKAVMRRLGANPSAQDIESLGPYRVENAVILAAGLPANPAPLSYEKPKGALVVRGEALIERLIRQLKEAGIQDITVVSGFLGEQLSYLEDAFGVRLVINDSYRERGSSSSVKRVEGLLGNTYLCSAETWYQDNPFAPYEYDSYRAAIPAEDGADTWALRGHAYWSREFSSAFVKLLDSIYDDPATVDASWEQIAAEHAGELPALQIRRYDRDALRVFDSLDDVQRFDPGFIDRVDSEILDNICTTLACARRQLSGFVPIKRGMTNQSVRFEVDGVPYVYRHPGYGSQEITNRFSETFSQQVASKLGIDTTFVYEDCDKGWKISRFVENTIPFDYHNKAHVAEAMRIASALHNSGARSDFFFDIHEDTLKQIGLLDDKRRALFPEFAELLEAASALNEDVRAQGVAPVLSHNDFYDQNFLVTEDRMDLIDWEFSGMSDYASDLGVFICCCPDYTYEDALQIFEMYFGRTPTKDELFHCVAYTAVVSFHWLVWALYKDVCGEPVGEFLDFYYRYTKLFCSKALEMKRNQ